MGQWLEGGQISFGYQKKDKYNLVIRKKDKYRLVIRRRTNIDQLLEERQISFGYQVSLVIRRRKTFT